MKQLAPLFLLLCAGCTTIVPKFPELPTEISKACSPLQTVDEKDITLSKLMRTVVTNYGLRHDCAAQVDSLLQWHKEQTEIFNRIK